MGPHAGYEHSLFSFQREFAEGEDFLLLPLRPTRHCECRTDRVRGRPAHGVHSGLLRRARNDVARLAAAAQRDFPQMQGKNRELKKSTRRGSATRRALAHRPVARVSAGETRGGVATWIGQSRMSLRSSGLRFPAAVLLRASLSCPERTR
jgi:hypothetical protein